METDLMTRTDIVVTHGAWSSGWVWKKMRPRLAAAGHTLWTPSYTGVGERSHLAHPDIDLDTHITDVVNMLIWEDLTDVTLLAHSYGGMVGTGVLDRARSRVKSIIYLDAFVPGDGDSAMSLFGPEGSAEMQRRADEEGDGWKVTANPTPPDTDPIDIEWTLPRRMPQPIKTFSQPLVFTAPLPDVPHSYIYCLKSGPGDAFRPFALRAASDVRWNYREIDASHNPHVTVPDELCAMLVDLI
ncbi:MAG: pimeloyl-ACP methyl ester carboxylesterase [Candidatus Poriferisodalaceae bacterium]|jgi:pimeloyl-ACP methyl ester carboxylesterase